ncbi:hypothetical protein ACFQZE_03415 [Paenibacillus sp. GCM10027627]|uniref:hypothetical protein n=1 Tax=unclassified Paenibacillus TaxID=185978 RepID=UPI00362D964F
MSRSWERKVRKNMSKVNHTRKKQGGGQLVFNAEKSARFTGRNFVFPILLIMFIVAYIFISQTSPKFETGTMYWVTIGAYFLLALIFFLRKPYLTIGKDYVQTRRFSGDRRLSADAIKAIRVQDGYVTVMPNKGAGWTFSRLLNRFQTDEMAEKLKGFAAANGISFEEK